METYEVLEKKLAEWLSVKDMVGCSSGSAALHLAIEALQLPKGSVVLIPNYTMIACARAVTLAGLIPAFIDCDKNLLLDPQYIEKACYTEKRLSRLVSAIMPVHIYGRRCDMSSIHEMAQKYNLAVIEDMAELHGVPPAEETNAAAWSFYANKVVAGQEGGAVWFAEHTCIARAKKLRCLGFTLLNDYSHIPYGWNYRISNTHSQLILDSLANYHVNLEKRWQSFQYYNRNLSAYNSMTGVISPWVYNARFLSISGLQQDNIINALLSEGIRARYGFKPMTMQEEYRHHNLYGEGVAEKIYREIICLPLQPGYGPTTDAEAKRIVTVIEKSLQE